MLREGVNRLRGQIWVRVECAFPERMLNLCGVKNLTFWDLEWETPTSFTCRVSRRDYVSLQKSAAKLECSLCVLKREGVPFFIGRFQNRVALMTGLLICTVGIILSSFFIWDFEIEGNRTVPEEKILRALEQCGAGFGAFGLSLDGENIRNHVLLEVPELSWITVNVSGCRAKVQVRERKNPPEILDETVPANIVARQSGMVLEIQALNGVRCVLPGTSVTEGQILISGVEDTDTFGAHLMTGAGTATARTWYTLKATTPLCREQKSDTGEEKTGVSLILGRRRIKFFANSSIEGTKYDKITQRVSLSLLGIPLPVTVLTERYLFYETQTVLREALEAEAEAETALRAYLQTRVEPYGSVLSALCTSRRQGDFLEVTLMAECREEIGRAVPILTQEADESLP